MTCFHKLPIAFILLTILFTGQTSLALASSNEGSIEQVVITNKFKKKMAVTGSIKNSEDGTPDGEPFSTKYLIGSKIRYELLDTSIILNQRGEAITADKLKVPCNATISFQRLSNGKRNVLSLDVGQELKGATSRWDEPLPK